MPSATTADRSDSMAHNMAMVNAGATRCLNVSKFTCGMMGGGMEEEITPKRLPIVSTGSLKACTAAVVTMMAISDPGIFWVIFGHKMIITTVTMDINNAYQLILPACKKNRCHFSRKSAGTF